MRSKKPRTIIERIQRLSSNSKTFKRFEERLKRQLIEAVIQSGIVDGTLDPRGKTEEQFRIETLDLLRNIAKSESSIQWTLDFRGGLLRQARRLRRMEKREEAILYYATWIEHMLNGMIATVFRRRKLSDEWVRDFIRETQLKAKFAFVVLMLSDKSPSLAQAKAIREIA